jgi:phosphate-selective porin OprO/OprP
MFNGTIRAVNYVQTNIDACATNMGVSRATTTLVLTNSSATNNWTVPGNTYSNQLDRQRIGLEGALASGPFKIQGQYVDSKFDFQTGVGVDQRPSIEAGYIQALWTLTGETHASRYKAGVFGSFKPTKNFDPDTMTGGAWEIGARYSKFDATDIGTSGTVGINSTSNADNVHSYTAGVKWITDPNTRFMLDYVYTDFGRPIIGNLSSSSIYSANPAATSNEKAINFRAQFDF